MPHRYRATHVRFETVRYWATRLIIRFALWLTVAAVKLLPKDHPVRIYIDGRIPEVNPILVDAVGTAPKSKRWTGMIISVGAALLVLSEATPLLPTLI